MGKHLLVILFIVCPMIVLGQDSFTLCGSKEYYHKINADSTKNLEDSIELKNIITDSAKYKDPNKVIFTKKVPYHEFMDDTSTEINEQGNFTMNSIVNPDIFYNWNKELIRFCEVYKGHRHVLLVSNGDSKTNSIFVLEYYKQLSNNHLNNKKAYIKTIEVLYNKYDKLDFKCYYFE